MLTEQKFDYLLVNSQIGHIIRLDRIVVESCNFQRCLIILEIVLVNIYHKISL
jgi:hypothetical protein